MWEAILFFSLAFLCLFVYLIRGYQFSSAMRWFGVAHGINTISLCTGQIMSLCDVENNLFLFHFSILFLYAAYAVAFYHALKTPFIRRLVLISIGVFTVCSLVFTATVQPITVFNSYSRILLNLLLTTWSLVYLYTLFVERKMARLEQNPLFWVSTGLLFTSLGSFFAYGLMSYLIERSLPQARRVYVLIDLMRFMLIIVLLVAAYTDRLFPSKSHHNAGHGQ